MEQQEDPLRDRAPPPSYAQFHDPQSLNFPAVPQAGPSTPQIHRERTLPPLQAAEPPVERAFSWPSQNPLTAYYQPGPAALSPKTRTTMDTPGKGGDAVDTRGRRAGSVLSIDDPDVRMAAEALGDLRADFVQSPPQKPLSSPLSSPSRFQQDGQPEPLLSLLTTSHPLLGTAIGGSLSAYSASKNYSPRFKSSAEYVERKVTPVVNTVGSVGRLTGVEGGVRWFLGGRRPSHHSPSDIETAVGEGSNKRRKVGLSGEMDVDRNIPNDPYPVHRQELQHRQRRPSQASIVESLPAYDEYRSPRYEAALVPTQTNGLTSPGSSWQSRLVLSTSGLSVAMSEESLRSLKYCLGWLRWANEHIGKVILALKAALEQYDEGSGSSTYGAITGQSGAYPDDKQEQGQLVVRTDAERMALNAKIAELKKDVLKTLKEVVDIVSKYAGGALPENARDLVRRHLKSLPQRFKMAHRMNGEATAQGGANGMDREVTEGAKRVMVLAKEGLDMMAQVSGVLDGTIVSAEEWCERLGRKKGEESEAAVEAIAVGENGVEGLEKAPFLQPPPPEVVDATVEGADSKMV